MSNKQYEIINQLYQALCVLEDLCPATEIPECVYEAKKRAINLMSEPDINDSEDGVYLEITAPRHVFLLGKFAAIVEAEDILKEASKKYPVTGLGLARELIIAEFSQTKISLMQTNITAALAGGLNIATGALSFEVNKEGFFLKLVNEASHDQQPDR